ncbi:MAG: hypothetical protein JXA33_13345, partial [Anaerolineae bacterium]|nr:hypothetical protein [Anaerolineae bacterium]
QIRDLAAFFHCYPLPTGKVVAGGETLRPPEGDFYRADIAVRAPGASLSTRAPSPSYTKRVTAPLTVLVTTLRRFFTRESPTWLRV